MCFYHCIWQVLILLYALKSSSMKWVLTNSKKALLQEYHLTEQNDTKVIVKYNPAHSSARISVGNKHRLFFIENAGSLSGKYVFKNEYGITIGTMINDKWGKEGTVSIESKKFQYKIAQESIAELHIYEPGSNKPIASCQLNTGINNSTLSLPHQTNNADSSYLLFGLCWFLFLPVTSEKIAEYAA